MRAARRLALVGVVALSVGPLAGCGIVEDALGEEDAGPQIATVALLVPGGASGAGVADGVVAAAQLAIEETTGDISGWTVRTEVVTEGADAAETTQAVEQLVDDDAVAVIGGLSTPTVRTAQPLLDDESVVFVSPADIEAEHTRGADPVAPVRPYRTYYRTAVSGEVPLVTLATYAVTGLGDASIAVIDCGDAPTAEQFAAAARAAGATVTMAGGVGPGSDKVPQRVAAAVAAKADAVFVAGGPTRAAMVADELRRVAPDVVLLASAKLAEGNFIDRAGDAAANAVSVEPAALTATIGAGPDDLAAKLDAAGAAAPGSFGAAAYDAGLAVGRMLAACLPAAGSPSGARAGCAAEMAEVSFDGVTGEVAFDQFGERDGGTNEIVVAKDGRWVKVTVS